MTPGLGNRDLIMRQVKDYIEPLGPGFRITEGITLVVNPRTELFMRMLKDDAGHDYLWQPATRDEPVPGEPYRHRVVSEPRFCGVRIITDDDMPEWEVHMRKQFVERWP